MATPTIVVPGVSPAIQILTAAIGASTTGTQSASNAAIITGSSITIPASSRARTAVVFGYVGFVSGNTHSNLAAGLDAGSAPSNSAVTTVGNNTPASSDGTITEYCTGLAFSIPGDGSSHTIALYTTAQGSTNSSSIGSGAIAVLVF